MLGDNVATVPAPLCPCSPQPRQALGAQRDPSEMNPSPINEDRKPEKTQAGPPHSVASVTSPSKLFRWHSGGEGVTARAPGRCCFKGQHLRPLTLHGAVQQAHRGAAVSQEVQGAGDAHPWDGAPQKHPHSLRQTHGIQGCTRGCTHSYFCRNRGEKMNGIPHSLQSCLPCNHTWESDSTHHLLSQWAAGISSYLLITVSSEHFPLP